MPPFCKCSLCRRAHTRLHAGHQQHLADRHSKVGGTSSRSSMREACPNHPQRGHPTMINKTQRTRAMKTLRMTSKSIGSRIMTAIVAACFACAQCLPALAQQAPLPENLNLRSKEASATAPSNLASPVVIVNGNDRKEVTAGMSLTPAQAVALMQMITAGTQSLILGRDGNAVGGSVHLTNAQQLASMTVPRGVTVINDFSAGGAATFSGNLTNSGNIYAVSHNTAVTNS